MQYRRFSFTLIIVALIALVLGAAPATQPDDDIIFKPPVPGAPKSRTGAGTRGDSGDLPMLTVLVPEQTAYTIREQPVLYWFISKPTSVRCEISIIDTSTLENVYEVAVNGISTAGMQKLDLAKEGVKLKPSVPYQWLVALVPDPAAPSKNVDAGGFVMRVPAPTSVAASSAGGAEQKAAMYARQGIFVEALSELSDAIAAKPGDVMLHQRRAKLLEQVGLKEAAAYEAKQ
jgi:hypothetical protein